MSNTVISVENVSKQYQLGVIGTGTFRNDLKLWWAKTRNKPNPLALVDEADHGNRDGEILWALKNVTFKVEQGEALGIIGRNGAGKSTLLKILSRVTTPTIGQIKVKGRIASLLEVGTGFHPELTGRENIFLNGAIMGMSRAEVTAKFDEIVDFSGVEKFIDTPVKRYSSGMYVRLAFAVAAHLEPEILIVDEVLAVGDAEFQKKCLGKMGDVAHEGRTVLFVSHNMSAIGSLCNQCIVLQNGNNIFEGKVVEAIRKYSDEISLNEEMDWQGLAGDNNVNLLHTWIRGLGNEDYLDTSTDIEIGIEVDVLRPIDGLILGFTLFSSFGYELAYVLFDDNKEPPSKVVQSGKLIKRFLIPGNTLAKGSYRIEFDVGIHLIKKIISSEGSLFFSLENISGIGRRFPLPEWRGKSSVFRPRWTLDDENI